MLGDFSRRACAHARALDAMSGSDSDSSMDDELRAYLTEFKRSLPLPTDGSEAPLISAASSRHIKLVTELLARGEFVDQVKSDGKGWTALMIASRNGDAAIVEVLLANGASVHRACDEGFTALALAADGGHTAIVKALLAHGAAADHQASDTWNALQLAARQGHGAVVRELLANGATVDWSLRDGVTALLLAAEYGNTETASILLAHGADVDKADTDGITPLVRAAENDDKPLGALLLAHGASVCALSTSMSDELIGMSEPLIDMLMRAERGDTAVRKVDVLSCGASDCQRKDRLRRCAGCTVVRYCSEQCQKKVWKSHKAECRKMSQLVSVACSVGFHN